MLKRFITEEAGATAIEYGLIAALMSVAMAGAFAAAGSEYTATYEYIERVVTENTATTP